MKKVFNVLKYFLILAALVISGYFIKIMTDLDIIPGKYYWVIIVLLIVLNIFGIIGLMIKKIWTKAIALIIYAFVIFLSVIGIKYGTDTLDFLNKGFDNNSSEVTKYDIIVLKESKYQKTSDLEDKIIGYISTDPQSKKALSIVITKVSTELKPYDDIYTLYEDLSDKKIDSIVVDEAYLDLLQDEYEDLDNKIKIIDSFDIENTLIMGEDNNKDPNSYDGDEVINIYISGSDSRSGTISNKSRSDVNMIMTINPKTRTILLTSIPRDYYVQLHGTSGLKDKLTHSGVYGINMSKQTVEDLFDIEIDYTIKVGFNSVIEIVDLVDGIDIESDVEFTAACSDGGAKKTVIKKGTNHLDGGETLCFVRQRYALSGGDKKRIQNQQLVLEAIIKKIATNKSLLLKYEDLLNSLSQLYRTDIPNTIIKRYIKNQLNDMSSWKVEKQWVDGTDASKETYTMPGRKLYVMMPDEDSLKSAKNKIDTVMKGE